MTAVDGDNIIVDGFGKLLLLIDTKGINDWDGAMAEFVKLLKISWWWGHHILLKLQMFRVLVRKLIYNPMIDNKLHIDNFLMMM